MIRARRLRSKIEASGVHEHRDKSTRKAEPDETRQVSKKGIGYRHATRTRHYESRCDGVIVFCRGNIVCNFSKVHSLRPRVVRDCPHRRLVKGSTRSNRGKGGVDCASRYTKKEFRGMKGRKERSRKRIEQSCPGRRKSIDRLSSLIQLVRDVIAVRE